MALVKLQSGNSEYRHVQAEFEKHSILKNRKLFVTSVQRVDNPALTAKFEAKRQDYQRLYGRVKEVELFHGTPTRNIPSIVRDNFDVERHGQNVGHRFGAGVSFSAMASYAHHYCAGGKSMLLCKVLISNVVQVGENKGHSPVLLQPPFLPGSSLRYDTTAKNSQKMDVIVKFEADTFLPAYVIDFDVVRCSNYLDFESLYDLHSDLDCFNPYEDIDLDLDDCDSFFDLDFDDYYC